MSAGAEAFVTLVTEVSLISREPNLRFERISLYLEDFSENRSVLFPSALDTIAEEVNTCCNLHVSGARLTSRWRGETNTGSLLPRRHGKGF